MLMSATDRELFFRFAKDYRRAENERVEFEEIERDGESLFRLDLRDAWEFATKKDYTENWESEMHERFCFWSESDWRRELEAVGFRVAPDSHSYLNPWIEENRLAGQVELFDPETGEKLTYPPTTILLIGEKL